MLGPPSLPKELLEIVGARSFRDQIPFLSPNHQCHSTERIYIYSMYLVLDVNNILQQ